LRRSIREVVVWPRLNNSCRCEAHCQVDSKHCARGVPMAKIITTIQPCRRARLRHTLTGPLFAQDCLDLKEIIDNCVVENPRNTFALRRAAARLRLSWWVRIGRRSAITRPGPRERARQSYRSGKKQGVRDVSLISGDHGAETGRIGEIGTAERTVPDQLFT
jgi:hypothetical protein